MESFLNGLKNPRTLLAKFLEQSPISTIITDEKGKIVYVNSVFTKLSGWTREDLLGKNVNILKSNLNPAHLYESLWPTILSGKDWHAEICSVKKDGTIYWEDITISRLCDDEGRIINFVARKFDITVRKEMESDLRASEKKFRELSIKDSLTGLYNSSHFNDLIKMETRRSTRHGQPLSIIFIDVDNFKKFNDTWGHVEGDRVLSMVGNVIFGCLRLDDCAARYGGEEFVILLPMTTVDGALCIAKRVAVELHNEQYRQNSNKRDVVTLSMGVTEYRSEEDVKDFVQRSDLAMYNAKNSGKNKICSL